jgi:hypothetical protein
MSFLGVLAVAVTLGSGAEAASGNFSHSKGTQVLGRELSAGLEAGNPADTKNAQTKAKVTILGVALQALSALVSPPNTIGGTTYTEVYSFGKRVFTESTVSEENGILKYHVGLSPTEIRVPAVVYPVGPVLLQIDGGARFQANVTIQNSTEISIPIQYSNFAAQISAIAAAAGFIEGYAKFFVLRAGVGGQLDLIDARADVNVRYTMGEPKPLVLVSAMAEFLKGRIYAFVDIFGLFKFGWRRLLDHDFYKWNGYCFATDNLTCPKK